MKQHVTLQAFHRAFVRAGRGNHFTPEALAILYWYLEDIAPNYELDVPELCRDYVESTVSDIYRQYMLETTPVDTETRRRRALTYLRSQTIVVGETDHTILYATF